MTHIDEQEFDRIAATASITFAAVTVYTAALLSKLDGEDAALLSHFILNFVASLLIGIVAALAHIGARCVWRFRASQRSGA